MGAFIFWARKVTSRNFLFLRLECSIFGNITKTFLRTYKKELRLGNIRKITQLGGTRSIIPVSSEKIFGNSSQNLCKGRYQMFFVLFNFAWFFFLVFAKYLVHRKNASSKSKVISYYFPLTTCPSYLWKPWENKWLCKNFVVSRNL